MSRVSHWQGCITASTWLSLPLLVSTSASDPGDEAEADKAESPPSAAADYYYYYYYYYYDYYDYYYDYDYDYDYYCRHQLLDGGAELLAV